jgi:hypothetical protein
MARICMGDGNVGDVDHPVAGAEDGLAGAGEGVLRPDLPEGQGAPPPDGIGTAGGLPGQPTAQAAPLHLRCGQDDIGEELHGVGVEGEAKLQGFPRLVAEEKKR